MPTPHGTTDLNLQPYQAVCPKCQCINDVFSANYAMVKTHVANCYACNEIITPQENHPGFALVGDGCERD